MSDQMVDSVTAARRAARLAVVALSIGIACGAVTWLFITVDHLGVKLLWDELPALAPDVPPAALSAAVVVLMTALAALVVALWKGRPFDTGAAEAEFDHEGRMDPKPVLAGAAFSLLSLFSGAAIGPEAPLTDINGGIGTFVSERLKLPAEHVKLLTYAGVAGAFGAFFGSAPVGALLAAELISPKSLSISRTQIVAGLAAGATGWTVYYVLGGHQIEPFLVFDGTSGPTLATLALALVLGAVGGLLGLVYGGAFVKLRLALFGLRQRAWLAAVAGGAVTLVVALLVPTLLFSGQSEVPDIITGAAGIGVLALVGLGIGKLAFSGWSLSTAYFGGPIFPLIFAGTCFGLALNLAVPAIPQGVAVVSVMTGMVTAAAVAPLSVTVFIALLAQPELAPAVAIAAVASFIVRQAIAPTLPGVYRATNAAERAATTPAE